MPYKPNGFGINPIFYWLDNIASICSAGVVLINILQIYNWFSLKKLCLFMSLFLTAEFFGYFIDSWIVDTVVFKHPVYYYLFGVMFVLFGVVDVFYFAFEPATIGVLVD